MKCSTTILAGGLVLALSSIGAACSSTIDTDASTSDVTQNDTAVTDVTSNDVQAIDVPATDVASTDVASTDATGTDAQTDTGVLPDGASLGCANGGAMCASGLMCCAGVPYPPQGLCSPACGAVSDRDRKQDFASVDGDATLAALARIPITSWSYRGEPGVRHIGPMAQDFRATFGLGTDERTIYPIDENGVTIAALQALLHRVERLEATNNSLRDDNRALQRRVDSLPRH